MTVQEDVLNYLKTAKGCARKERIAGKVNYKTSSVAKALTFLRKEKKVGLFNNKYWGYNHES